ncbi:MAG: relaxase/mobilization nuclease domain-containing protein, partial [Ruminococcus sp.]|nr:relaxase/mobilization nuclease domain-containing protein [Ruminococcus sp.]
MAIIKAVSSKSPIKTAIVYVSKEEKTDQKLLSGYNLTAPETAYYEMQITKEVWNKTDGRTYKHYVQSFAPDEEITPEQVHAI